MKKSQLVQIIKEALTDKVKAASIPVSKLQKGDTMAADKAKVTSIKKDGDNFEITLSGGKKLNYKKDKQVQIIRAGSTLKENTSVIGEEKSVDQLMSDLGDAILADNNEAMKIAFKNLKTGLIGRIKNKLEKQYTEEPVNEGLFNNFSDYDTVFEIARHKAIPFAVVGMLLVKYGIAKAKELVKRGKEEAMDAIEDSPKEEPSTTPTKRPIKLFKKRDNKVFNQFLDNMDN